MSGILATSGVPKKGGIMNHQSILGPYDTRLSDADEQKFQAWSAQYPKRTSTLDYDMRGWWKENGSIDPGNGHFNDKYKKPNHPTFSEESIYSGKDGNVGGNWVKQSDGSWSFKASHTNLSNRTPEQLQDYFKRVEPGNTLILPDAQ